MCSTAPGMMLTAAIRMLFMTCNEQMMIAAAFLAIVGHLLFSEGNGVEQMMSSKSGDSIASFIQPVTSAPKQHRHKPDRSHVRTWKLSSMRGLLLRLLRPSVKDGHQRLEWTCNCGRNMYGDYTGSGLDSLAAKLRNINKKELSSDADMFCKNVVSFDDLPKENESQSSSPGGSSQPSGSSDNAIQATIPWTTSTQPSQLSLTSSQSLGLSQISRNTSLSLPSSEATPIQLFLELCVNRSKYLTSIGEIEIINAKGEYKIQSDFQLFGTLTVTALASCCAMHHPIQLSVTMRH